MDQHIIIYKKKLPIQSTQVNNISLQNDLILILIKFVYSTFT